MSDLVPASRLPEVPAIRRPRVVDREAGRQQVKANALARFGLALGKRVRQSLLRRVRKGDVKYARKLTNSRTVIVLDYAGQEMAFLYSNATQEIVSFLAPDAPETGDWRRSQSAARALFPRGDEAGGEHAR
jgi:hypothetical protein